MSVEIKLSITDYHNILIWYELAFGRKNLQDVANRDQATFRKLTVMAQGCVEEQKALQDDDRETT